MNITSKRQEGELSLFFSGELDHHAARCAIPEISKTIDSELPLKLIFDFSDISFMDSSGIALVIGGYKKVTAVGGEFSVINVPRQAYKVFLAAGICKIMNITTREPALSKM